LLSDRRRHRPDRHVEGFRRAGEDRVHPLQTPAPGRGAKRGLRAPGAGRAHMVALQASGCAPMVRAYDAGTEHATRWEDAHTIASGIRVPQAIGDFLILRAVRESKGYAVAVTDEAIPAALDEAAREDGFLMCPEGAATYAAWKQGLTDGRIRKDERALLFNCATRLE